MTIPTASGPYSSTHLLVAVLVACIALLLAGCGPEGKSSSPDTDGARDAQSSTPDTADDTAADHTADHTAADDTAADHTADHTDDHADDHATDHTADHAQWTHETTVGRIVAEQPDTARVFELVGIDYCCGGHQTVAEACAEQGTDPDALLAALAAVRPAAGENAARSWINASLTELVDHIEATHHAYLRRELPRLASIVETVARVHGDAHPELAEVKAVFDELAAEIPPHLVKEEVELFPAVRRVDATGAVDDATRELAETIEREHDDVGNALHRLRELTSDFAVPDDACTLYKQMLSGLEALEEDMHAHVHKENNILLPRLTAR